MANTPVLSASEYQFHTERETNVSTSAEFSKHAHIKSLAELKRFPRKPPLTRRRSGQALRKNCTGSSRGTKCSSGTRRGRNGSSAARSTSRYNCLDRHVQTWRKNKAAIIWEGEPGDSRTLTYQQLLHEVQKFANVLKSLGVKKGDRVAIYMGMVPELPIAMLACARIGARAFGDLRRILGERAGGSHQRLRRPMVVITQDGGYRRGSEVKLKAAVDEALDRRARACKNVLVYKRTGTQVTMDDGRDHWWHELMARAADDCPAEQLDSRASAVHSVHVGHDRQAEGHRAHDRRLCGGDVHDIEVGLRPEGRRHLLVHGRHRLGDRAQLHRVRSAAERRDGGDVRRRAELARAGSLLADHREA